MLFFVPNCREDFPGVVSFLSGKHESRTDSGEIRRLFPVERNEALQVPLGNSLRRENFPLFCPLFLKDNKVVIIDFLGDFIEGFLEIGLKALFYIY